MSGLSYFNSYGLVGENPPSTAKELIQLPAMSYETLMNDLRRNTIEQICLVAIWDDEEREQPLPKDLFDDMNYSQSDSILEDSNYS